jgi:hypothetical protein
MHLKDPEDFPSKPAPLHSLFCGENDSRLSWANSVSAARGGNFRKFKFNSKKEIG